jgi:hypothetical protein
LSSKKLDGLASADNQPKDEKACTTNKRSDSRHDNSVAVTLPKRATISPVKADYALFSTFRLFQYVDDFDDSLARWQAVFRNVDHPNPSHSDPQNYSRIASGNY